MEKDKMVNWRLEVELRWRRVRRVRIAERVPFIFRTAINIVPVKTVAAVTATPDCTGLLLVVVVVIVLFDEVLYDTIQAHRIQLKLNGHHRCHHNRAIKAVLLKMRLLIHDLLQHRRGIPQNARELEIKEPLQPRLRHQLHWVDPHRLFRRVKIDRLDLHW